MKALKNKCPICKSTNITNPKGLLPALYAVEPYVCNDCEFKYESSIIFRIFLWVYFTAIFLFLFLDSTLLKDFDFNIKKVIGAIIIGSFPVFVVVGAIVQIFRPWQFQAWGKYSWGKAFNYFAILSMVVVVKPNLELNNVLLISYST